MKKLTLSLCIFLFSFSVCHTVQAETVNAGFIPAPIWFSAEKLEKDVSTKIYTLVYNTENEPIALTVSFYDGDILLGKKVVTVPAKSSKEVSIDWKVTLGDHAIRARIENPHKGSSVGEMISVSSNETDVIRFTVLADLLDNSLPKISDEEKASIEENKSVILSGAEEVLNSIDDFRSRNASKTEKEIKETKELISKNKEINLNLTSMAEKGTGIKSPIQHVKLFFLKIIDFILTNSWAFYGLIILIIFLLVRFLIVRPR